MHHDKNSPFVSRRQLLRLPTIPVRVTMPAKTKPLAERPLKYWDVRNRAGQIMRAEVGQ